MAAAMVPTVPITVIAFGLMPARTSSAPMGSVTREREARARMLSMRRFLWTLPVR